jgi:hypothetical protein
MAAAGCPSSGEALPEFLTDDRDDIGADSANAPQPHTMAAE